MRLFLAFRAFFAILFQAPLAAEVTRLLAGNAPEREAAVQDEQAPPAVQPEAAPQAAPQPSRSDAVTLLATLQREARFIDIVKEPLGNYSDAQVGAAARDVLRDCSTVLDRMFSLQPIVASEEGADLATPAEFDAGRYRLVGNVTGDAPYQGKLVHHGWEATHCDLPKWNGSPQSELVVAPVELEIS